jgi:hypothetical protein
MRHVRLLNAPDLVRGSGTRVTNLLSSFGDLKETHLTSMLGYLFHLNKSLALHLFGIEGLVESVFLEPRSKGGTDRYDIVLLVSGKRYVIEAKLDAHSSEQVQRYSASNQYVYLIGARLRSHASPHFKSKNFRNWNELATALKRCCRTGRDADPYFMRLAEEFIRHLEEHQMIESNYSDVYVRDLSGESVEMYFNLRIYRFQAKFFEGAKSSRYFAPYLTGSNLKGERQSMFRALGVGISFISKVDSSFIATEREMPDILSGHGYSKQDMNRIFEAFKWRRSGNKQHAVLLLGEPMRLVQRPITKNDLWGVSTGAMPSISLDFGVLLSAANGHTPLAKSKRLKAA